MTEISTLIVTHEIDPLITKRDIDELVEQPLIIRVNEFDEDSAEKFARAMSRAATNPQRIIPVVIDSYGGYMYALLQMIDVIRYAPKPVMTVVQGKAMSCASILASCGTKGYRYIAPTATLMIHDVSSGCGEGKIEEIKVNTRETERLQNIMYALFDDNTGKERGYFWNQVQARGRADWYLTPEEAREIGLVDHIGIPTFKTTITVQQDIF